MWTLPAIGSPDQPHRALSHGGPLLDPSSPDVERFRMPFSPPTSRLLHEARTAPSGWRDDKVSAEPTTDPLATGLVDQLERLARLHRDGDLTDDEFSLAKARLLQA